MLKKVASTPEGTRERILRTAIAEFSEKGYNGARVLTICRKSRANPRMIYHYFGGKDRLYVAVLEHVLGELRREELKLDIEHVGPVEGMMQLFDFTYEHFGKHPELIHLLSGENFHKTAIETVESICLPNVAMQADRVELSQQVDAVNTAVDAV